MRYVMKQKLFSLGDRFTIRDADEQDRFVVAGRVLSLGHQLSFQDMSGSELLFIRQRLLKLRPTYELSRGDTLVATIEKELFTLFHCTFDVHLEGHGDLVAEGNFSDHEYTIARGGEVVATVSKAWFSWSDTYGVDIADKEDDVLLLASTVVIDMCCHPDGKQ